MFHFIDNLQTPLPYDQIMVRLGARLATQVSTKDKERLDKCIYQAKNVISLKAIYKLFEIKNINTENGISTISTDEDDPCQESFESYALAKYLSECSSVYLVGITAGKNIATLRDVSMSNDDTYASVVSDAVGSECVEAGIEVLHKMLQQQNIRTGGIVSKTRFSPGYQDLPLTYQHVIKKLIPLDKIGITITDSAMMTPEKSVTAFIGVK